MKNLLSRVWQWVLSMHDGFSAFVDKRLPLEGFDDVEGEEMWRAGQAEYQAKQKSLATKKDALKT